jgi:AcrR family transcriptional regulator
MTAKRNPKAAAAKNVLVRGEPIIARVLDATIAELAMKGYKALRIEEVADRASVARTTVYRRWPTKAELVRAAIEAMPGADPAPPSTGSLRGDLVELGMKVVTFSDTPEGEAVMGLFAADGDDRDLRALLARLREERSEGVAAIFEAARERGETISPRSASMIGELLPAGIFNRKLIMRERVNRAFVEELVDFLLGRERRVK